MVYRSITRLLLIAKNIKISHHLRFFSVCLNRLGIEDGRITDGQITASSVNKNPGNHPTNARLNRPEGGGTTGAWIAGSKDLPQWIQVYLGEEKMVSGVILQGRENSNQWVTRYKVQYGNGSGILEFARPEYHKCEDDVLVRYDLIITSPGIFKFFMRCKTAPHLRN